MIAKPNKRGNSVTRLIAESEERERRTEEKADREIDAVLDRVFNNGGTAEDFCEVERLFQMSLRRARAGVAA